MLGFIDSASSFNFDGIEDAHSEIPSDIPEVGSFWTRTEHGTTFATEVIGYQIRVLTVTDSLKYGRGPLGSSSLREFQERVIPGFRRPTGKRTFQAISFHVRNPQTGAVHYSTLTLHNGEPARDDCATVMACGSTVNGGELTTDPITCKRCSRNGWITSVIEPAESSHLHDGELHSW